MICHLLGLAPHCYVAFDVPYAAVVAIDLFDGKGVLSALERPEMAQGGQSHFRGDDVGCQGNVACAAKIGTVPAEDVHG
jgi:hypothetical protein